MQPWESAGIGFGLESETAGRSVVSHALPSHGPPGSLVYGISQARILERVAVSFSRGSS